METKDSLTTENNKTIIITEDKTTEFSNWLKKTTQLAREEVKKEIAKHKAAGNPIFYSRNSILVMELADGRCYEYRRQEDGTREIIRELPARCQS